MIKARAEAEGESSGHFIGALALLAKKIERAAETGTRTEFVNTAAEDQDTITHLLGKGTAQVGNVFIKFAACLHDKFGCGGRCGGAHVGHEIRDGEVAFMADARDRGNFRVGNGAGDHFFVEGPQIFERAAAARENQHIHRFHGIEELHRLDDFLCGAFALDPHRKHREMDVGKAAPEDAHDVAHRGSSRRGDEADAAREERQRLLPGGSEQAFGFKPLFQLIESKLQSA